jgi:hypothetical protein
MESEMSKMILEPSYKIFAPDGYMWELIIDPDHGAGVHILYYDDPGGKPLMRMVVEEDAIDPLVTALLKLQIHIREQKVKK